MEKELDPKEYHVLDSKKKKVLLIILGVVFLLILPVLSFYYIKFAINRPAQKFDDHTIEIKSGWGVLQISQELYSEDLINSQALFTLYILINNLEKNIQAGVYDIPAGTSIKDLAYILQHGTDDQSITFIEGWRVEEFAFKASEKFENVDYEDFVSLALPYEGYLFPDTYVFAHDVNSSEMIDHLREIFDEKTKNVLTEQAMADVNLTKDQVITLASIVEREVSDPYDRPLVAGVLIKRYREGLTLGADATVQYYASLLRAGCDLENSSTVCPEEEVAREVNWWPLDLTKEELEYDSEYNTRKFTGFPPTPISSVSISAIEAVLNNKETSFNYYLTAPDGTTYFSETLPEHERKINLHLR